MKTERRKRIMEERDYLLAFNCGQLRLVVEGLKDIIWVTDNPGDIPMKIWHQKTRTALSVLSELLREARGHCVIDDEDPSEDKRVSTSVSAETLRTDFATAIRERDEARKGAAQWKNDYASIEGQRVLLLAEVETLKKAIGVEREGHSDTRAEVERLENVEFVEMGMRTVAEHDVARLEAALIHESDCATKHCTESRRLRDGIEGEAAWLDRQGLAIGGNRLRALLETKEVVTTKTEQETSFLK